MTLARESHGPPLTRPATALLSLPGGSLLVSALVQFSMSADSLPCLKIAVARRRGIPEPVFLERYMLFTEQTALGTVNQLRAPTAVKAMARRLLHHLSIDENAAAVAIQGAGNMGGFTALLLHECGVRVTAWAGDQKCLVDPDGLPVPELLRGRVGGRLPYREFARPSDQVLSSACDLLILAAVSDAIEVSVVDQLRCRGIVVAANLGIAEAVEWALAERGIVVVPDLLASVGGSVAVEALYAQVPTTGEDILNHVDFRAAASIDYWLAQRANSPELPLRSLILESVDFRQSGSTESI